MELWTPLDEFPRYSVSDLGRVRNDSSTRIMSPFKTGGGHVHVGLVKDGSQFNRSVAKLVAQSFLKLPNDSWSLPTPINLNGDKEDCRASNLMWRPRWFALKFTQQFDAAWTPVAPIRSRDTGIVFQDVWNELIMISGLLFSDIIESVSNRTYVFPTFERFEWA